MAGAIENYSKFEVRAAVKFLQAEKVSRSEIYRRLVSVYGQNVFNRKEVSVRWSKFKDGQTALNDDPQKHIGISMTSHTDENGVTVEGLMREDRRVKVPEIAEVTGIAKKHCS
jgi:hypothetical protein